MNVLYLESGSSDGGSFESLRLHLAHLGDEQLDPHVVFLNPTPYEGKLEAEGVTTEVLWDLLYSESLPETVRKVLDRARVELGRMHPRAYLEASKLLHAPLARQLRREALDHEADLVHLNDSIARDFYAALVADDLGIPCVSHLRAKGGLDTREGAWLRDVDATVDRYIANSRWGHRYWSDRGLPEEKIEIVHNAVPPGPVEETDPRDEWDLPSGPVLITVGRLLDRKGHRFLLDAFARLLDTHPEASLLVVGDGPRREPLEDRASELGVRSNVRFTGYRADAVQLLAGSTVSVVPSRYEPFGRVVIESMQAGTPVVATRVGGIPEIVDDGEDGLLVEFGDAKALAGRIAELLDDPKRRARLAEAGRRTVEERFSVDRYVEEVHRIYEEVLAP